jgi:hypothetical protein
VVVAERTEPVLGPMVQRQLADRPELLAKLSC